MVIIVHVVSALHPFVEIWKCETMENELGKFSNSNALKENTVTMWQNGHATEESLWPFKVHLGGFHPLLESNPQEALS